MRVPVIAAGGIADARGVAAAIRLGAARVQVGTAYLLCPEVTTSPVYRAALPSADASRTALTNLISGRPARGIMKRPMRELGPMSDLPPEFPMASAAVAPLRAAAEARNGRFLSIVGRSPSARRSITIVIPTDGVGMKTSVPRAVAALALTATLAAAACGGAPRAATSTGLGSAVTRAPQPKAHKLAFAIGDLAK